MYTPDALSFKKKQQSSISVMVQCLKPTGCVYVCVCGYVLYPVFILLFPIKGVSVAALPKSSCHCMNEPDCQPRRTTLVLLHYCKRFISQTLEQLCEHHIKNRIWFEGIWVEEGGGGSLQDGKSNLQQAYQITQKKMKVPKLKQTASHALAQRSFFFSTEQA